MFKALLDAVNNMWRMDRRVFLVDCVYLLKNSITFRVERNAIETFYLKFTGN